MGTKKKVGIVGQGFVGTALKNGFKKNFDIETYDKYVKERSTCESLEELCSRAKIIFVCLPTPMRPDGSCDLSIVDDTIKKIDDCNKDNVAVIKSTIPPGTTENYNKRCKNIQVVFNPEFLTERFATQDFLNTNRIIIGGPRPGSTIVKQFYAKTFPSVPIVKTGSNTAEMVKYTVNTFLAAKVAYANELYQICSKFNVDYDKVIEYSKYDKRLGDSHWNVPGHDGHFGFGGSCFPKDLNCLINVAKLKGINPVILESIWEKNLEVRPEKDWEQLKGRAVSKGEKNETK